MLVALEPLCCLAFIICPRHLHISVKDVAAACMQTSSDPAHSDDSLHLGASMSGCAVPEQRGTLSPVGCSSWSAVELLGDERDLSPDHSTFRPCGPRGPQNQPRTDGESAPRNNLINTIIFAYVKASLRS
jgi:hypothetical protein